MGLVNVLLCCSGSVATLKIPELVVNLTESKLFNIRIVCSKSSLHFLDNAKLYNLAMWKQFESIGGMKLVFTDKEEWSLWNKIGDPVLHIELSNWADVVLVAPCSADLIAKINAGISDNLLLSVLRAWDFSKPCIMCPSMNTMMWNHPVTGSSLKTLESLGWIIIQPIVKTLACNVVGIGAMAKVTDIIDILNVSRKKIIANKDDNDVIPNYKSKVLKLHDDWIKNINGTPILNGAIFLLFFVLFFYFFGLCLFLMYPELEL